MNRTDTISWVVSVCAVYLRRSQAKTLAALVASAMRCQRVSLANLGRNLLGTTKSTNRDIECSIWTIGWIMLQKITASPPEAFAAVLDLSESVAPNWG